MTKLRAGAAATLDAVTRRPAVVALAAAACAAIAALAVSAPGAAAGAVAPAMVTASHGRLELSGDRGTGYLELHNATARQVVVQAAVSPVAASVVWATRQQVITPAHLYTASGLCEDVPALESEANAAAHALHDLRSGGHAHAPGRQRGAGVHRPDAGAPTRHPGSGDALSRRRAAAHQRAHGQLSEETLSA